MLILECVSADLPHCSLDVGFRHIAVIRRIWLKFDQTGCRAVSFGDPGTCEAIAPPVAQPLGPVRGLLERLGHKFVQTGVLALGGYRYAPVQFGADAHVKAALERYFGFNPLSAA